MPYANDAEHLAVIDDHLAVVADYEPERDGEQQTWIDWYTLDVPFLRQQLAAAEARCQRLEKEGKGAMDSVALAIRGGLDISHPKREAFLAYVRSMPRVATFLEALAPQPVPLPWKEGDPAPPDATALFREPEAEVQE